MAKPLNLSAVWLLAVLIPGIALADSYTAAVSNETFKIDELGWGDHTYLEKQVARIDKLARTELGTQVRQDLSDLDLLQRIVDRSLIDQDDTATLQAMGAVLGNVMTTDIPALEWKVYEDELGRSRALCAKGTHECLFPITMLSRRMEVGLKPDVDKVYEDAIALMAAHLPQYPYGGGTMRKLQK
jgi:hypothetical protein